MRDFRLILNSGGLALATALCLSAAGAASAAPNPVYLDQGPDWNAATRADYYSRDQGSRIIPLAWARALKTTDGSPFLGDGLARYGYLPNPGPQNPLNLPVGFMRGTTSGTEYLAMNCAGCHTRQIAVGGVQYRVDGGPALVDFYALLFDMDAALGRALANDAAFAAFAVAVLGPGAPPSKVAKLKADATIWHQREHAMVTRGLPTVNWGLGRLDAVSMIYNRVSGMDIGPPPTYLIEDNIRRADAPVRYPFLWNAPIQDRTQWPGFAQNGDDLLALARNLAQVYGVFGIYRPRRKGDSVDFLTDNSTVWDGVGQMETLVKKLGPPKWAWGSSGPLAAQGQAIFNGATQDGGCVECHGIRPGPYRFLFIPTWATKLCDVGTDSREYSILHGPVKTGVLAGASGPGGQPLGAEADKLAVLSMSVIGSFIQKILGVSLFSYGGAAAPAVVPPKAKAVLSAYAPPTPDDCPGADGPYKYESRVLQGVWAAAPYLHNGSVPTLADLLKPAKDRPKTFKVGSRYDTTLIGLDRDQGNSKYEVDTTGCGNRDSGNSRCGHEYGTALSDARKRALLEYLKTL
jgi:hypothetical protein